jgi:hypothetical protein
MFMIQVNQLGSKVNILVYRFNKSSLKEVRTSTPCEFCKHYMSKIKKNIDKVYSLNRFGEVECIQGKELKTLPFEPAYVTKDYPGSVNNYNLKESSFHVGK